MSIRKAIKKAVSNTSIGAKANHIEFKIREELYGVVPEPVPAANMIPKWYKNTELYLEDEFGVNPNSMSIRGCMPFFEALTAGWILRSPADIVIRASEDSVSVDCKKIGNCGVITDQKIDKYGDNKLIHQGGHPVEIHTPWYIDAPEGYSVWVLPPLNRWEYQIYDYFHPFSGIYDVDTHFRQAGIVAMLDTESIDIVRMKAGTPIAQLVFFNRDGIAQDATISEMTERDEMKQLKSGIERDVNPHVYREEKWHSVGSAREVQPKTSEETSTGCPFR